jgi:hypothetical protein
LPGGPWLPRTRIATQLAHSRPWHSPQLR